MFYFMSEKEEEIKVKIQWFSKLKEDDLKWFIQVLWTGFSSLKHYFIQKTVSVCVMFLLLHALHQPRFTASVPVLI